MASGIPGWNDLYEVDIVQCKADGTEVWGKLLINGFNSKWKDESKLREAPSTFLGCLLQNNNPDTPLEAVSGARKDNKEMLLKAIEMPHVWYKEGQEFLKAINMDPERVNGPIVPPNQQPGGAPEPPDLPAVHSIYCLGRKLEGRFVFRVHEAMVAGRPLILLGEGETYDETRWAPIAGKEADPPISCTVL